MQRALILLTVAAVAPATAATVPLCYGAGGAADTDKLAAGRAAAQAAMNAFLAIVAAGGAVVAYTGVAPQTFHALNYP
jgi:hypothetical protein